MTVAQFIEELKSHNPEMEVEVQSGSEVFADRLCDVVEAIGYQHVVTLVLRSE